MFNDEMQWMPDQKTLLVKLVPDGMGAPPPEPVVPIGPSIQETGGEKGQSSTYENRDTLSNKHDEDLFDYYAASQLALVNAATGAITPIGKPGNYESLSAAPDGQHVLVTAIHKPYSYVTTYDRFPKEVEVWDVSEPPHFSPHHRFASACRSRSDPGVPVGTARFFLASHRAGDSGLGRGSRWRRLECEGSGSRQDHAAEGAVQVAAREIARTEQRYDGFGWSEQPSVALLNEYDENRHWRRTFIVDVDDPQEKAALALGSLHRRELCEPRHSRGTPARERIRVVRQDGDSIYLSGVGSSPDGDRPFLDRLDLKTLKSERLFRSDKTSYERFLSFTGPDTRTFLTWHQSPTDPPNAFLRTLGKPLDCVRGEAAFVSASVAITHIPDPTPEVRAIKKRLVKYKRADGA